MAPKLARRAGIECANCDKPFPIFPAHMDQVAQTHALPPTLSILCPFCSYEGIYPKSAILFLAAEESP